MHIQAVGNFFFGVGIKPPGVGKAAVLDFGEKIFFTLL